MIVAIPVNEKKIDSEVCISFGRTPLFLIYDTESKEEKYLDNSAIAETAGAGIKAAQSIVDNNVEVMITPRMGENANDVLVAAEVKMYKTEKEKTAKENIDLFLEGKLNILDNVHPGFHGGHTNN